MKLLFVHGGEKLKIDAEGNYYTGGSYNSEVWDRYLSIFKEVTVMLRKDLNSYTKEEAQKQFQHLDKNKIGFIEMPDMNASVKDRLNVAKRTAFNRMIKEAVLESEYVIARLPGLGGEIAIRYAREYGIPYFVELVGCPWDSLWNHSLKGKVLAPYSYLSLKNDIKHAPYVLYVTNQFLQNRYPSKGKSAGCSDVSLPQLNKTVLENRIAKIDCLHSDSTVVLGTTAPLDVDYKGQKYVIEAISLLNNEGIDFEYHLVGDGSNKNLKELAKKYNVLDKIRFIGPLTHKDVYHFLDSIDIYIQPSKTEGLSRAVIEAMSRACPVMGTNVGGNPELINENYLFSKGNVEEISNLLKGIDKKKLKKEAESSYQKALQFDKDLLSQKRHSFYEEFYLEFQPQTLKA